MGRAAIFIDGAYLDFMARGDIAGPRFDHARLIEALTPPGTDLLRAYYYASPPHISARPAPGERDRRQAFDRYMHMLSSIPRLDVRLGTLARRYDASGAVRFQQKRVDLMLGVDMVLLAAKGLVSEMHLVAGDSDFVPALKAAKDEGVVCILHHGPEAHHELRQVADECHRIDAAFIDRVRRT